jgi:hypothetical protein
MKSIYSLVSSKQIPQYEVEVLAADAGWQTYKQRLEDGYSAAEAAVAAQNAFGYSAQSNPYSSGRRVDIVRKLEAFASPFDDQADGLNRYRDPSRFCGENLNLNDLFQTYELALGDTHRDLEMTLRNTNALEHHQMPIWREIYDRVRTTIRRSVTYLLLAPKTFDMSSTAVPANSPPLTFTISYRHCRGNIIPWSK